MRRIAVYTSAVTAPIDLHRLRPAGIAVEDLADGGECLHRRGVIR